MTSTMSKQGLDTPILLMVFNRQKTTARVFEAIRQARPRRLFVAADGPRPHVPSDAQNCRRVRALATAVDWPCEVTLLPREHNLGCRMAVSSAITWFFQHVEEGIILEDDTLPTPGFFDFCQVLLAHYRNEPRVMHISGSNFQLGARHGDGSYYFSRFNHIWGWATWRRAWAHYDLSAHALAVFKDKGIMERLFADPKSRAYWLGLFERTAHGEIDTWDYPWTMSIWGNEGLSVLPQVNLVSNIGFGKQATHTTAESRLAFLPVGEPELLRHPDTLQADTAADTFSQTYIFSQRIENAALLAQDIALATEQGRPGPAAELAQRFLTLHPQDLTLQVLRIAALHQTGALPQSLELLEALLARNPEHEGARALSTALGAPSQVVRAPIRFQE